MTCDHQICLGAPYNFNRKGKRQTEAEKQLLLPNMLFTWKKNKGIPGKTQRFSWNRGSQATEKNDRVCVQVVMWPPPRTAPCPAVPGTGRQELEATASPGSRAAVGLVPNNTHPRLTRLSEYPASHRETVVAELRGHSHLLWFHVLYLDTYQLRLP